MYDEARRLVPWAAGPGGPRAGSRGRVPGRCADGRPRGGDGHAARRAAAPRRGVGARPRGRSARRPAPSAAGERPRALDRRRAGPLRSTGRGHRTGGAGRRGAARGGSPPPWSPPARPPSRRPSGLVHGDCKPSQFLIGPAGVTLLDLDHCGLAEPASDVGTFLATLRQQALRGALAGRPGRPAARRSSGSSTRTAPPPMLMIDFMMSARWYQAVALCRKALRAFARSPARHWPPPSGRRPPVSHWRRSVDRTAANDPTKARPTSRPSTVRAPRGLARRELLRRPAALPPCLGHAGVRGDHLGVRRLPDRLPDRLPARGPARVRHRRPVPDRSRGTRRWPCSRSASSCSPPSTASPTRWPRSTSPATAASSATTPGRRCTTSSSGCRSPSTTSAAPGTCSPGSRATSPPSRSSW